MDSITPGKPLDILQPVPLVKKMIGLIEARSCGAGEAAADAEQWIRAVGPGTILSELKRGTRVWIYKNMGDQIVGFGSLGSASWSITGRAAPVQYIPALAVFAEFQGLPTNAGSGKYCRQILNHILDEADNLFAQSQWVGLSVRKENAKAIALYQEAGFVWYEEQRIGRMLLKL